MKITIRGFILIALYSLMPSISSAQQIEMAVPAPKGILIFAGMELPNGNKMDNYTIERSYNNKQWEIIAELKSPDSWDAFYNNFKKWTNDFGFQGIPQTQELQKIWKKCDKAGIIDSAGYWASSSTLRLAAGIAYYDQTATKNVKIFYKIKVYKDKKVISEHLALPVQWAFIPKYDNIVLNDKNVDKTFFYLKWQSKGGNPAPYFGIRYYEDKQLKTAKGTLARYTVEDATYYIFQDSTIYLKSDRQYFLNPIDLYGNQGSATDIVFVSKASTATTFFSKTKAQTDAKGFGVILSWQLKNIKLLKEIRIYKSESFDKKEYSLVATIPASDTTYIDRSVTPDKMYYYYLIAESSQNDQPVKSNIFFNAAYDKLKPIPPIIQQEKKNSEGVHLMITTNEMNVAGIKIYRNNGIEPKLYPITDVLPLKNNMVIYTDTSKILTGERSFLYVATAVNTSSIESTFSDSLIIQPNIKTIPPMPYRLSIFNEDNEVKLVWDDVKTRHSLTQGYKIYRREMPNGKLALLLQNDSLVLVPFFIDRSTKPNITYEYAIQTVDDLGNSSQGMITASIYIKPIALPIPPNVWLEQNAGKVTVQWNITTIKEDLKINLYRYQRGSKPQLLNTFSLTENQYIDTKVKKGELFFYFSTFIDQKTKKESAHSKEAGIKVE